MIYKVEGDILLSKAHAIAHGVGINDPMDKGLSLELQKKYPSLPKDFHRWCHQHNTKPGEAWLWNGPDRVHIMNLITQEGMGSVENPHGKATLSNVKHALNSCLKIIAMEKITSIAMPRLATGVGDLDWDDVLPIMENHLSGLDIPVYIYAVYRPGQQAHEPGLPSL